MIEKMKYLTALTNKPLFDWLNNIEVDYVYFSFRWLLCFLVREMGTEIFILNFSKLN